MLAPDPSLEAVPALLAARGVRYVTKEEWLVIDAHEVAAGKPQHKPRVKLVERAQMLALLKG